MKISIKDRDRLQRGDLAGMHSLTVIYQMNSQPFSELAFQFCIRLRNWENALVYSPI